MSCDYYSSVDKIYTIGYEGKTIDEFLKLLMEKSITHLVDVRSVAKSRRKEFSQNNIKDTLFKKSILYEHMKELGGLDKKDYRDVMKTEGWKQSYEELKELASKGPTVIMCLEKDPMKCHRRFIAERLEEDGWDVIHLGRGGSWKERSLDDFVETS